MASRELLSDEREIKPPMVKIGTLFKIKGEEGIYTLAYKDDNIYHFENKENGDKKSLIYGQCHPTRGYFTGEINPNLEVIK